MARFVHVARVDEIPEGRRRRFEVEGRDIVILCVGDEFFAINHSCPHRGGPLGDGVVTAGEIICPQHRWKFDLATGATRRDAAVRAKVYPVKRQGDDIYVGI
ncbi:MAG: Rieske 2Fe-2S domain-containing protein [Planctomycetota bacterium]